MFSLASHHLFDYNPVMRKSVIKDQKYRGYLIRPTLSGYKIYRKGFYVGVYPSRTHAKDLIDAVIQKRRNISQKPEPAREGADPPASEQLSLFP